MYGSLKRSTLLSILIHAAAIVLVVVATRMAPSAPPAHPAVTYIRIEMPRYVPSVRTTGGGGGGGRDATDASKGKLPKPSLRPFTAPKAVVYNLNPILSIEPAIYADPRTPLPVIPLPNYGDPNGANGPLSNGTGSGDGIGSGDGGGVGKRKGPGYGDDADGGGVSGVSSIRASLTPPILLVKIEPEYSDEARRAKIQGTVMLVIDVDTHGDVHNIRVQRSLGLGLDEKAMDAVSRWKFRPGTIDGKPAVISAIVEVNFRLL